MTQKKKVGKYCKVVLESYKDELIIQNNLKCLRSRKQNRLKFSQMPMDTQRTRDQGLVYRTRADPGKTGFGTEIMDCWSRKHYIHKMDLLTSFKLDGPQNFPGFQVQVLKKTHLQTTVFPTGSRHPA